MPTIKKPSKTSNTKKYRVLEGIHADYNEAGEVVLYGKGCEAGDIVESDKQLDAMFGTDKFVAITSDLTGLQIAEEEAEARLKAVREKIKKADELEKKLAAQEAKEAKPSEAEEPQAE